LRVAYGEIQNAVLIRQIDKMIGDRLFVAIKPCIPVGVVPDSAADLHVKPERIRLNVCDRRVLLDKLAQREIPDELLLLRVEIALIPEAVAVSRARELVDENRLKRRPEHAAG